MIQFNIHRFGKLAKWALTNDRSFYTKQALTMLTILTLLFVCTTTGFFQVDSMNEFQVHRAYQTCYSCCIPDHYHNRTLMDVLKHEGEARPADLAHAASF